ncbi:bifunctional adenosylcobinamide kinase/adenosylcobinamide-phosphate guanylyltransferase [Paraburkholderia hayleyella]|uniref:bifunctional adenosylcobinamide kinase/adenosylcobinamide-phosphate guanylyltransferase n=1 Tax=Paraburkholderia hayleyella TaxID=2152889 RepID=UPI001292443B|nr:bifunctional adenosylcobinamide kinase/adenosylcobinamide-phosphate guanylyltransferase [Paraburkholderia hayleyella]
MPTANLTFILGGARSGKSAHAEQLATTHAAHTVTYIATARGTAGDHEFATRIAHHQTRRPTHWHLLEAPWDLAAAIVQADGHGHCILIDCLTLWLANFLCPFDEADAHGISKDSKDSEGGKHYATQLAALETALTSATGQIIVVSNEIGLGVVPLGSLTRQYVDELGRLNQRIATLSTRVTLMVAGVPLAVKTVAHA